MPSNIRAFLTPIDIANRALQHCGASRIAATGWPPVEDSKEAQEVAFTYDKVRQAELRRNLWTFALRRAVLRPVTGATLRVVPPQWDAAITYPIGAIVRDTLGYWWQSTLDANLGQSPGEGNFYWDNYFGPGTCTPWDSTETYSAGEMVYTSDGIGNATVYVSLTGANTDDPTEPSVWDATETYYLGQVVQGSNGWYYRCQIAVNIGNDPLDVPEPWTASLTYATSDIVAASDGLAYYAVQASTGQDPVADVTNTYWAWNGSRVAWAPNYVGDTASLTWRRVTNTVQPFRVTYPAGTGPASQTSTLNLYAKPVGYLRRAPEDPKAGINPALGAPAGIPVSDITNEGEFLVSRRTGPIMVRFVADTTAVFRMDPMFCEGLAARIAYEIVETLTQATGKKNVIAASYKQFMTEARTANGIENGTEMPPEDEFIVVRQ